jgi:APA family basic amino acid/polyamine antiporter
VTVLNFETLIAGSIWLLLGIGTYVIYRRRQGLSLTETHKIVTPKPVVEHEVEYRSVLVAFEDGRYSADAVATAQRLAARGRRGIHVIVTITVPPNSPIDAEMPDEEAREIRAEAVVMELPPKRAGASLFGKTIETVLSERPCRVIIESTRGTPARSDAA